jgi:hypothetical protein
MADKESSKKVARAMASGAKVRSRRDAPFGFYTALVLVIILGIGAIAYSKYELVNAPASSKKTATNHLYVALGFDSCGRFVNSLPKESGTSGFVSKGNGIFGYPSSGVTTLPELAGAFKGISISSNGFEVGSVKADTQAGCSGKRASFHIYAWTSLLATKPVVYNSPTAVVLHTDEVITVAVLPKGVQPKQPPTAFDLTTVGGKG